MSLRALSWHRLRRALCDFPSWHAPMATCYFDGCSYVSLCRFCERRILQDSNGDWFDVP